MTGVYKRRFSEPPVHQRTSFQPVAVMRTPLVLLSFCAVGEKEQQISVLISPDSEIPYGPKNVPKFMLNFLTKHNTLSPVISISLWDNKPLLLFKIWSKSLSQALTSCNCNETQQLNIFYIVYWPINLKSYGHYGMRVRPVTCSSPIKTNWLCEPLVGQNTNARPDKHKLKAMLVFGLGELETNVFCFHPTPAFLKSRITGSFFNEIGNRISTWESNPSPLSNRDSILTTIPRRSNNRSCDIAPMRAL